MEDTLSEARGASGGPSSRIIDVSQSIVWTNAQSLVTGTNEPVEIQEQPDSKPRATQNACLLFAKIAATAQLRCVNITDYDSSQPLGQGLSFEVVGMDPPIGPWYRNSHVQINSRVAVKRIRVGRIDDEASASKLRPLLHSIILELQILTNPGIRSHENIISCVAAGYQHFSYDTTYLLPLIFVEYTNWTTLVRIFRGPRR
jgi:hypothetical protein